MTGPTGNKVEMVMPSDSRYVPKLGSASDADRASAKRLLDGVRTFCHTHTAAQIKANWRPAAGHAPLHYFNRNHDRSKGLHPARPRAALIFDGRLGGVMFVGSPLPHLGSIPRAHAHHMSMSMGVEMVHVYCTANLKDAYTPNRMLGVEADTIALRSKIRPALLDLNKAQLREVRHRVRHFCGDRLDPVRPHGTPGTGGPDPVMQAMRQEIRDSLMILHEANLRRVWWLMTH